MCLSSNGGVPILLQLLHDAAEQQLAVCTPLPETSVVRQGEAEETSPESVSVSGAPSSAESQASCQTLSPTGTSDEPVTSGDVSTSVNADHPGTTVAVQSQVKTIGHV